MKIKRTVSNGIMLIAPNSNAYRPNAPLGLAYLAAVLEKAGYDVEILPVDLYHMENIHAFSHIARSEKRILGITGLYPNFREIIQICNQIITCFPEKKVIIGGPLLSSLPEYVMRKTGAHIGIIGEAEDRIVSVISGLEEETYKHLDTIPGLVYNNGNEIKFTQGAICQSEIADIPWPARHLLPMERYLLTTKYPLIINQDRQIEIIGSRGCSFKCTFCYHPNLYRSRPIDDIINEMEYCVKIYGATHFYFRDELFTAFPERTIEFCDKLRQRLQVTFHIDSRIETITSEMLRYLHKTGCLIIGYGLESADQLILDKMNKGFSPEQAVEVIRKTRELGMHAQYSAMWGYPGDDSVTLNKLINLLKKLADKDFNERYYYACTPFPDSVLYRRCLAKGIIESHDDFFHKFKSMRQPSVNMTDMPDDEFRRCFYEGIEDLKLFYASKINSCWKPFFVKA